MPDRDTLNYLASLEIPGARRRRQREEERRRRVQETPDELDGSLLSDVLDLGTGVLGGAVGLAQSVGETVTFGALPDFDNPFQPETTAGQITQGITEFLLGFIPVAGWIGRGASVGRKALLPGLTQRAQAIAITEGKVGKAAGIELARDTAAGGLVDAVIVDQQEERLSNLLRDHAGLRDPVTAFLAADPSESAAEAKLKGVLEGALAGGLIGGFVSTLSAVRAARRLRADGRPPEEVVKPILEAEDAARQSVGEAEDEAANVLDTARDAAEQTSTQRAHTFGWTGRTTEDGRRVYEATIDGQSFFVAKRPVRPGRKREAYFELNAPTSDENVLGTTLGRAYESIQSRLEGAAQMRRVRETPLTQLPETITVEDFPGQGVAGGPYRDDAAFREILKDFQNQLPKWSAINPRQHPLALLHDLMLRRKDLNLLRMPGDEASIIRVIERRGREGTQQFHRVVSNQETIENTANGALQEIADIMRSDRPLREAAMDKDLRNAEDLMHRVLAYKTVTYQYAFEMKGILDRIIQEAGTGTINQRSLTEFLSGMERLQSLQRVVKGLTASQGRALQTGNIPFLTLEKMQDLILEAGGQAKLTNVAKKLREAIGDGLDQSDLKGLFGGIEEIHRSGKLELLSEYWINSILSGGKTLTVNLLSNSILSIYLPMEQMVGAAVMRDMPELQAAAARFWGLTRQVKESFRAAKELTAGELGLGPRRPGVIPHSRTTGRDVLTERRAFSAERLGKDPTTPEGRIIDTIGSIINYPTALLAGTDEFFRNLNFRATAWSRLVREELGRSGTTFHQAAERATTRMDEVMVNGQAFSPEALSERFFARAAQPGARDELGQEFRDDIERRAFANRQATKYFESDEAKGLREISQQAAVDAKEATLTRQLGEVPGALENVTRSFQGLIVRHPMLRFFVPFIRTPYRIARFATDRTVDPVLYAAGWLFDRAIPESATNLRAANSRLAQEIYGQGATSLSRAQALGRLTTSFGLMYTFQDLARQGVITGAGPADREQRRLLEQAGWLPYSVKIGDNYVQYLRLDPFATLLGLAADIFQYGRYTPEEDQGDMEDAAAAYLQAVALNITSRTYMKGVQTLVEALGNPERRMQRLMETYAASFIPKGPAEAFSATLGVPSDPYMRDVQGIADAIRNRTPYFGQNVAPIRNFLGEPVHRMESLGAGISSVANMFVPIMYSSVTSDKLIEAELGKLKHAFQPPNSKAGGIDLRGFTSPSGQTAFDRLLELRGEVSIGGKTLRRSLRELMRSRRYQQMSEESTLLAPSPRIGEVNAIINRFHRASVRQMWKEFPEVEQAYQARRRLRRDAVLGR